MKLSIVGSGYVGMCTSAGFALKGNEVTCVDIDKQKVDAINSGRPVISEEGLEDALRKTTRNLRATTDLNRAINETDITFVCVGTPSREDGSVDTTFVEVASKSIGIALKNKKAFHTVVVKSTVIPGTTEKKIIPAIEKHSGKKNSKDFSVCVNPEFLREGSALDDFLSPDRIVVGCADKKTLGKLSGLYSSFNAPIITTDIKTAEMIKYASNVFLAAKISLINEIGNICKKLGIDTYEVAKGVGYDKRIGGLFLNSGVGFGGSCFSKDVKALSRVAKDLGYDARMLEDILNINDNQRRSIVHLLKNRMPNMKGTKVAVLGLAFKAGTDDVRGSPATDVVSMLKKEKCKIVAYDPKASGNFKKIHPDIEYAKNASDALTGADACLILTDWKEFKNLSRKDFSVMKSRIIIEGRRVLNKEKADNFEGVCW